MDRLSGLLAPLGLVAAACAAVSFYAWRSEVGAHAQTRAALEESLSARRLDAQQNIPNEGRLDGLARPATAELMAGVRDGRGCRCPEAAPCAEPAEVHYTEQGDQLRTPEQREAYVRSRLEDRIEAAYADDPLDPATRERAVELLLNVRRHREAGPDGRMLAQDAEIDFIEEMGMGVGEFLDAIAPPAPARPLDARYASGAVVGEERKRFESELARKLGVTTPGSTERLGEGGEWVPESGAAGAADGGGDAGNGGGIFVPADPGAVQP